jgi:hypothetical protein
MVKIRFRQDRVVQDGLQGTAHETRFKAGEVADLPDASANHWITRGVAERVSADEPAELPAAQQAAATSPEAAQQGLDGLSQSNPADGDGDDADPEADGSQVGDTNAGAEDAGKPERKSGRGSAKSVKA